MADGMVGISAYDNGSSSGSDEERARLGEQVAHVNRRHSVVGLDGADEESVGEESGGEATAQPHHQSVVALREKLNAPTFLLHIQGVMQAAARIRIVQTIRSYRGLHERKASEDHMAYSTRVYRAVANVSAKDALMAELQLAVDNHADDFAEMCGDARRFVHKEDAVNQAFYCSCRC
jgi:hypothetical protein